ncbi:MAG: endonuclease domain-containing protein [Actinomycetota bacterium]
MLRQQLRGVTVDNDDNPSPHLPPASSEMVQAARDLRRRQTPAEAALWERLRANRLRGRKFRRQHPVGVFVLDFFCDAARLVIELDGGIHLESEQRLRDVERQLVLETLGLTVLRFRNEEVLHNVDGVLARTEAHLDLTGAKG